MSKKKEESKISFSALDGMGECEFMQGSPARMDPEIDINRVNEREYTIETYHAVRTLVGGSEEEQS